MGDHFLNAVGHKITEIDARVAVLEGGAKAAASAVTPDFEGRLRILEATFAGRLLVLEEAKHAVEGRVSALEASLADLAREKAWSKERITALTSEVALLTARTAVLEDSQAAEAED